MNRTFRLIKNSLQARISLAVIAVSLLLAVIAGGFSFYTTYHETEELQDDLLRQTAALSSSDEDETDIDSDSRIFTQRPGKQGRLNIPADLSDGFHDLWDDGDDYRIYLHHGSHGPIAVIQENEYRADLAENAAFHSVIPLLLSIPLTILLTVWVVSRTMLPVKRLSQSLSVRQEHDLSPLNDTDAPSEMTGFIAAINRLLKRTDDNIRQQQRFIADAAHEMRSPMTALSLQVERLNQLPLADDAKLQARQIQTSIAANGTCSNSFYHWHAPNRRMQNVRSPPSTCNNCSDAYWKNSTPLPPPKDKTSVSPSNGTAKFMQMKQKFTS